MAQKVQVTLTSDLSGKDADETVTFGLDGITYEVDLTTAEAEKFRKFTLDYVGVARKVAGGRGRPRAVRTGPDPKAVREWARANGHTVPERGRIPADVVAAFKAAGN